MSLLRIIELCYSKNVLFQHLFHCGYINLHINLVKYLTNICSLSLLKYVYYLKDNFVFLYFDVAPLRVT